MDEVEPSPGLCTYDGHKLLSCSNCGGGICSSTKYRNSILINGCTVVFGREALKARNEILYVRVVFCSHAVFGGDFCHCRLLSLYQTACGPC